jgi:CBS domain-containing protein
MAQVGEKVGILYNTAVQQIVEHKPRLVEVPYTATVNDALNTLLAKNILAVPVAAPPGQWIGAGGSMILESDRTTGAVRKQYIGMVSVLDILMHIAECEKAEDVDKRLIDPVSSIIGHSMEGLSLWSISPQTSVFDAMEPMSKGIHRALIPIESKMEHTIGVELMEASPGYHIFTQTDMVQFLYMQSKELDFMTSKSVLELGAVQPDVYAAPDCLRVMEVVKCIRNTSLQAVAIVETTSELDNNATLVMGNGRKLVGTFSASDLLGCTSEMLRAWATLPILSFFSKAGVAQRFGMGAAVNAGSLECRQYLKPSVTCQLETSLAEVMSKALANHVHRVWVVDNEGKLNGVVSFSDMIRVVHDYFSKHDLS